jgi:hypothetical protein
VKTRESGMPEEAMWDGFFDPPHMMDLLGVCGLVGDVVEFGCGYPDQGGDRAGASCVEEEKNGGALPVHRHFLPQPDGGRLGALKAEEVEDYSAGLRT